MQRRDIAKAAVAGVVLVAALPVVGRAASDPTANITFSADDPGQRKDVEGLHVPIVTVSGSKVTITTPHPMSEPHFIVSHTVVLAGSQYLDRKTFTYKDLPVSEYRLPAGYAGLVTVTSTCNLHDVWVKTVTV